ncbi:MAG: 6,7-dimethyl-8-ribityllumazine synthase [Thermovirgaceae bacterium]|nr:6,7-dimethyl-8-ribityllumazine synthase [Thermovirgaceae bacterium]
MRIMQGKLIGTGLRFLIAVSRFNELISSRLLEGARDFLLRHDVSPKDIDVVWVPGSWELPLILRECALTGKYDALIALGAIIRGDTPHFDFVAAEVSKGLAMVEMEQRVPVSFGVLTCDTLEQALLRAGSKSGNKGSDAAAAAIEMADLLRNMRSKSAGDDRDA